MKPKIKNWLLDQVPPVIWVILAGIKRTLFTQELFPERIDQFWRKKIPVIVAFWHSRMAVLPFVYRGRGVKILISPSRDGELVSRVLGYLGLETVRGSSSKRSCAIRPMIGGVNVRSLSSIAWALRVSITISQVGIDCSGVEPPPRTE